MLLVCRRNVARALEQDSCRVALTQSAPQAEFEIFKALDRFRPQIRRRPGILENMHVGQLTEALDRTIQLRGRDSLLRHLIA